MSPLDPTSRLYFAFAFGVGIALVGIVNAAFKPSRGVQFAVNLLGSCTAAGVIFLFAPELTLSAGLAVAAVSLVWQLSRHANVTLVVTWCLFLFRRDRFRWAALAAVGLSLLAIEMSRFDDALEAQADADLNALASETFNVPASEDVPALAHTDAGAMVPLVRTIEHRPAGDIEIAAEATLNRSPHREYLIRRGAASDRCNCHGWVFAGGLYGVHGKNVDQILNDNKYAKVIDPRVDDLCVYRGTDGAVLHTAVVRAVCPDGTVLVEGKWGWMGVYMHPAGQSCYGDNFRFYRSDRPGHVLAGLQTTPQEGPKYARLLAEE